MKVLAFSAVTNPAADRHAGSMSHKKVLDSIRSLGPRLSALITECAKIITDNSENI
jgi:purine nucleoside phosphorylase